MCDRSEFHERTRKAADSDCDTYCCKQNPEIRERD